MWAYGAAKAGLQQSQYESWSRNPCLGAKDPVLSASNLGIPGSRNIPVRVSSPDSSGPARWVLGLHTCSNSNSLDAVPSQRAPKRLRAATRRCHVGHQSPSRCVTFRVETSNPTLILRRSGSKDSAVTRDCWFRKDPTPLARPAQLNHTAGTD